MSTPEQHINQITRDVADIEIGLVNLYHLTGNDGGAGTPISGDELARLRDFERAGVAERTIQLYDRQRFLDSTFALRYGRGIPSRHY